jgi:hypothetical protein
MTSIVFACSFFNDLYKKELYNTMSCSSMTRTSPCHHLDDFVI